MPNSQGSLTINGRYACQTQSISGGMADVYPAVDLQSDFRRVAVKIFKSGKIENEIIQESFNRETQALKELKHPGIVEILDSGQDENTGDRFLVLEWMEQDLTKYLQQHPLDEWDSFWKYVGFPLLEVLAFSHDRQCIHRDIKPSNILFNAEGDLKLADFGISKLKGYLQPSVTLRDFVSRPFAPPEADEGSYTYTRDVFSFGVLVLKCLTNVDLRDYADIPQAVQALNAPQEAIDAIERSVSLDPLERQQNAGVLLAELKNIPAQRKSTLPKKICYLYLTPKTLNNLQDRINASESEIKQIILEDLNTVCGISRFQNSKADSPEEEFPPDHYSIFGESYRYHIKVDEKDRNCLVILNAQDFEHSFLEKKREQAWEPPYEFKFGQPARRAEAIEVIEELQLAIEEHEADRRQAQAAAEKQRLFRVWGDILRAKKDWEEEQETPLEYKSVEVNDNRAAFELSSLPENDIAGQSRCVKHTKGFGLLAGEVEEIKGNKLILYIKWGDPDRLPQSGELRFDIQAAEVAINRQKAALDAVQFDRSVRADMRQLLVNPQEVRPPEFEETIQFTQPLNPSQEKVVKAALGNQDFLIVQGPPGTGKTTFITEAIVQTLQQNPQARILLSSQTHVALDNALERIQAKKPDLKLLRIGNHERVADNIHPLLLEEQMNRWREEVLDRAAKFLADWSAQKGISPRDLKMATLFQELRNIAIKINDLKKEVATRQQQIDEITGSSYDPNNPESIETLNVPENRLEDFQTLTEEIEQLRQQLKSTRKEQKEIAQKLKELTETGVNKLTQLSASELELRVNELIDPNSPDAKLLKKLLAIQTEWFEQFGRNNTFNMPLIKRSQLVAGTCIGIANNIQDIEFDLCIVDEASKATATEVLVPMSRAKQWILVGDPKQLPPFQDDASRDTEFLSKYDLKPEDIKETLFDRLLQTLPEENRQMLTIQHRMIAPIGDLVSHCFYDGQIESARKDVDRDLEAVLPKPVTWFTTTKRSNRFEQSANSSFNNACEVNAIFSVLQRLNEKAKKHYTVAILTGYSAQLKLLNRRLASESNHWNNLTVECNTVDAFQGREADIAIYSVTRSNKTGKLGFLRETERMNVALSRGKIALIIVGDHYFCRTSGYNPLQPVLEYIESHHKDCILEEVQA